MKKRILGCEDQEGIMMKKFINTVWECWTYDVWGNAKDGYEVNDRCCFDRNYELRLLVKVCNAGTPQEFECAYPSDTQIRRVFGIKRAKMETDRDNLNIYVRLARDSYPVGEMNCVSHKSLSPCITTKETT